jgi:hypothetical protein
MENASTGQRDGKVPVFLFAETGRKGMIAALDGLDLIGPAAFERDCLSFMLDGWPAYPDAGRPDECFTLSDVIAQIDDLRIASQGDREVAHVLEAVSSTILSSAPTAQ